MARKPATPSAEAPFVIQRFGNTAVVELMIENLVNRGDQDRVVDAIAGVVDTTPQPRVIVSFEHVKHISSTFLGKLIALNKRIREEHGQLTLVNINPQIKEVFALTKLDTQIPIRDTVEDTDAGAPAAGLAWNVLLAVVSVGALAGLYAVAQAVRGRLPGGPGTLAAVVLMLAVPALPLLLMRGPAGFARRAPGSRWAIAGAVALVVLLALAGFFTAG